MTVKELIEQLQQYPEDMPVGVWDKLEDSFDEDVQIGIYYVSELEDDYVDHTDSDHKHFEILIIE